MSSHDFSSVVSRCATISALIDQHAASALSLPQLYKHVCADPLVATQNIVDLSYLVQLLMHVRLLQAVHHFTPNAFAHPHNWNARLVQSSAKVQKGWMELLPGQASAKQQAWQDVMDHLDQQTKHKIVSMLINNNRWRHDSFVYKSLSKDVLPSHPLALINELLQAPTFAHVQSWWEKHPEQTRHALKHFVNSPSLMVLQSQTKQALLNIVVNHWPEVVLAPVAAKWKAIVDGYPGNVFATKSDLRLLLSRLEAIAQKRPLLKALANSPSWCRPSRAKRM